MRRTPFFWARLVTILELKHWRGDEVIWESNNLPNILHKNGQEFILTLIFDGDFDIGNTESKHVKDINDKPIRPSSYFIGLDNRATIASNNTMATILGLEPITNGYARQTVSSETGFELETTDAGKLRVATGVIRFSAIGGTIGPVLNMFVTNKIGNDGYLVATAPLDGERTINDGESLTMRLGISLSDC